MKYKFFICVFFSVISTAQTLKTPFELGNGNQTPTYGEMIKFYETLDTAHKNISIKTYGLTDSGEPLKVVFYDSAQKFDFKKKSVILINNGIHPGEPDGIDASMMMMRDFAEKRIKIPENLIIAVIQTYNIGGMLNRGKFSRANQNGPEEYGFRGNAKNYDLNRDFIKSDTKNTESFQEIFHELKPIYFIDNHVSNGADYQYTLTYITTNKERLGKILGDYQEKELNRKIFADLQTKGIDAIPYVNVWGKPVEKGYEQFMDSPRYATGYTSLFNTMGQVMETHMLKPYPKRVQITYENMLSSVQFIDGNVQNIRDLSEKNLKQFKSGKPYTINWKIDSVQVRMMDFKGYESGMKPSEISGKPRLSYDRNKPYTKKIPFYHSYISTKDIAIPRFYVVPKSEYKVVNHLKRNQIKMTEIKKDSAANVQVYKISDYKTYSRPYEGHYPHYQTVVTRKTEYVHLNKGDFLISTDQPGVKYLLETLEPEAVDSFFNWNFFDSILSQKEHYSPYVFEDTAAQLLKNNKALKTAFEMEKAVKKEFSEDGATQLEWVYQNSDYFEKSYLRYPIYRIN